MSLNVLAKNIDVNTSLIKNVKCPDATPRRGWKYFYNIDNNNPSQAETGN